MDITGQYRIATRRIRATSLPARRMTRSGVAIHAVSPSMPQRVVASAEVTIAW